jgi:hypothetical protein
MWSVRWTLIQLTGFRRLWEAERMSDEDLRALEAAIMRGPAARPPDALSPASALQFLRDHKTQVRRGHPATRYAKSLLEIWLVSLELFTI